MNEKQLAIFVVMIVAIMVIIAAGISAIALLRRNGHSGVKISIKATVITLIIVFLVAIINLIMLGVNEG